MPTQHKYEQKDTQFQVYHQLRKMRKALNKLMLDNFGYNEAKTIQKFEKQYGNKPLEQMSKREQANFYYRCDRYRAYSEWYINKKRDNIEDLLKRITCAIYVANSTYPVNDTWNDSMTQRRLHQEQAIGLCYALRQEYQDVIDAIGANVNRFDVVDDEVEKEINLLIGWKKNERKNCRKNAREQ